MANVPSSVHQVDVTDNGADPLGIRDSTTAIQTLINAVGNIDGEVVIPDGIYRITSTLTYTASSTGRGITIRGKSRPGRGIKGAILRWDGNSTDPILNLRGANNAVIENLTFDPYTDPGIGAIFLEELNSGGGPGSSGVIIRNCHIQGGIGANSYCIRIGDNNYQVSEVQIEDCSIYGSSGSTVYGVVTTTGNTKNFTIEGCSITDCDYGVTHGEPPSGGGSGFLNIINCSFTNQRIADVFAQTADSTCIIGCGSEQSAKFLKYSGASTNAHSILIQGCYWHSSATASDDVIIEFNGQLSLIGNNFRNDRVANAESKIIAGAGTLAVAAQKCSVTSIGNSYAYSQTYAPIYDSSGSHVAALNNSNYISKSVRVFSSGDIGGSSGSLTALQAIYGPSPRILQCTPFCDSENVAGITYTNLGEPRRSTQRVTLSYTNFTAASTTHGRRIFTIPAKTRIVGIIMDTTTAFAGTAGTLELRLGTANNGQTLVLTHDVKTAAVTKGLVDGDFGTAFVLSAHLQGGIINWSSNTEIWATLNSGSGHLGNGTTTNLSQGSCDVWLITESMS